MDKQKQNLKGSESKDEFKRRHKDLSPTFYCSDIDLVWVCANPPEVIAHIEFKTHGDSITFTQIILFNRLLSIAPVYIVEGFPETGEFYIREYLGGDSKSNPPTTKLKDIKYLRNWNEFEVWEWDIRNKYAWKEMI